MSSSIVSTQNRVESPFIILKIGNYTFGHCSDMSKRSSMQQTLKVTFPNYMQSLNIVKINGTVNLPITSTIPLNNAKKASPSPFKIPRTT